MVRYSRNFVVGDYVQFAHSESYMNSGVHDGFVMLVTDVDHYDGTVDVAYQDVHGTQRNTTVPMHGVRMAEIVHPDENDLIRKQMRMERAHYRKVFNAMCEVYIANLSRINYVELTTAMFNVTVHKNTADVVTDYCGPTTGLLVHTYAAIPAYIREEKFMQHLAEIRSLSGLN